MKKKESQASVRLELAADKAVISSEKGCRRILEVTITPPVHEADKGRAPLNLALVLDRSGSMQGEKLHYARQAAAHVLDLLEEKDLAAVVFYDDQVDTVIPSTPMNERNKAAARERILSVQSGGSTFLFGGWLRGCELAAEHITAGTVTRTLLLSDGLANVGITSMDELCTHTRQLNLRGQSTSCFGVGHNYDEHLLEGMANSGGGNFHFIETLNAIPLMFEREFEELSRITLRDAEVTLTLPEGVSAQVSGGWQSVLDGRKLTISIGSLISGRPQAVYIKLDFQPGITADGLALQATLKGNDRDGQPLTASQSLPLMLVSAKAEQKAQADQALMERFARVEMADAANEALRRERAGDRHGAASHLYQRSQDYDSAMPAEMKLKYVIMQENLAQGLNESDRKRFHAQEYLNKRGRGSQSDYPLRLVNGCLVTEVDGRSVLVDTGAPISISRDPQWTFMDRPHKLVPSYLGVNLDLISREVGQPIDVLLGADILKHLQVGIHLPAGRISFETQALLRYDERLPLELFMGVPAVKVQVNGQESQLYLDSGSRLCYLQAAAVRGMTPAGHEEDFFPDFGRFETDTYTLPVQIGLHSIPLTFGVLPPLLETAVLVSGCKGIIGTELFKHFSACLDFPGSKMHFSKLD